MFVIDHSRYTLEGDEHFIKTDEFCILNDELCIKNDEFAFKRTRLTPYPLGDAPAPEPKILPATGLPHIVEEEFRDFCQ